jgi:hypothetical protein
MQKDQATQSRYRPATVGKEAIHILRKDAKQAVGK